jgi:glyoxylase-like metal-dependent hydrolase (beta-lactamase superfamily II)
MVETDDGLLLIDTGFGLRDCVDPTPFMWLMIAMSGWARNPQETAIKQIERLGYVAKDVHHIALTHFHFDHAGGLPEFPQAKVHLYQLEYDAITNPRDAYERYPYRREHWAHGPDWNTHQLTGDHWFDFECTPLIDLGSASFCFVPLTGHTRGHSAVALRMDAGWLLHCGDAYAFHREVDPDDPSPPPYQRTIRPFFNINKAMRPIGKHSPQLRTLLRKHGDQVQLTCSHDPHELSKFTEGTDAT